MKSRIWQIAIVFLTACGCRMGQDTWDYSRPVQGSPSIPYPATTSRAGSISSRGSMAAAPGAAPVVPQPATNPTLEPQGAPRDEITRQPATSTLRR